MFTGRRRARLSSEMDKAVSYQKWEQAAVTFDDEMGLNSWKQSDACESYDYRSIRHRLDKIRDLRMRQDYRRLLFTLNEGIHGNLGGIGKPSLYNKAKSGTKNLIHQYIQGLSEALEDINRAPSDVISEDEKKDFFLRTNHCYGRSALMLSGGASLGFFHVGVLIALAEQQLLPHVISGSSAGAIFASVVCTHTDQEILEDLDLRRITMESSQPYAKYRVMNIETVVSNINRWIPDLTFQQAYERTGRALNITVSGWSPNQASRLLNAITSPNVTIRSAVLASSAVYGVYPPVTLEAVNADGEKIPYLPDLKWIDGSFLDDFPAKRLARLYGVNHFISSMINPAVLATTRNPDKRQGFLSHLMQAQARVLKFSTLETVKFGRRYFRFKSPAINMMQYLSYNVLAQDYTADINLFPRSLWFNPARVLALATPAEIKSRIQEGERATWERIEMIRNCTSVSRSLDRILKENNWSES
ncbi:MAG TPA: DUF3336 domain-containing protein [Porticoccus sp.]|nr:DUF3336 domain-containing protein [Porticoccus sp.]